MWPLPPEAQVCNWHTIMHTLIDPPWLSWGLYEDQSIFLVLKQTTQLCGMLFTLGWQQNWGLAAKWSWAPCKGTKLAQGSLCHRTWPFHLLSHFFNIYCHLKNRNTCLSWSYHGIPDEKPFKENNKMQFESKPMRLPGHAQPDPWVRSQEDADSPPTMKLQGLLQGRLLLSSSTYQISPSFVFCTCLPKLEFSLREKQLGRWHL